MKSLPAVIVLMLIYMTSLVGLTTPAQQSWYLTYTAFFLWMHAIFLLLYHQNWDKTAVLFCAALIVDSFIVESVLLHTQCLLTDYSFGSILGTSIMDVPITIGLYWFTLIYSTACLAGKLPVKNVLARTGIGTILMLGLLLLIHPIAQQLGFWEHGSENMILYYGLWTILCFAAHYFFHLKQMDSQNRIAVYVYGGLAIFFSGLLMFLNN